MSIRIIAEAGVNHNGDPQLARELVDAAVRAGVDIIKFQTFRHDALTRKDARKARYQAEQTGDTETQADMLRKLELGFPVFVELAAYCDSRGIAFLSTPFDDLSIDFLATLHMPCWKVPSGEITNLPYLRRIGALRQEVILSTGMSTLDEVAAALDVLEKAGTPHEQVTLLHCTTEYPAPLAEVNLRAMGTLRAAFPRVAGIGYSDHTEGLEVPVAAAALGATVLEKHFTLDRGMEGPDHKASLEPGELAAMVTAVRKIELALGSACKAPTTSELVNRDVARKSLVAKRAISCGEVFSPENVTTKRPGTGLSPMLWDSIIGTLAQRDFVADEALA